MKKNCNQKREKTEIKDYLNTKFDVKDYFGVEFKAYNSKLMLTPFALYNSRTITDVTN